MIDIHKDDDMFHGSIEHYDSVGRQMADFVEMAQVMINRPQAAILELPCGYGRVTRKLVERFGPDRVFVAEIMAPALEFCSGRFGVSGYQVTDPVNEFKNIPDARFDIAVMGSLITHLSEENSEVVFRNFFRKISSGGVGVVTTTGVKARELLENSDHYRTEVCQVGDQGRKYLLDCYDRGSFGYAKYVSSHTFEQRTVELIGDSYGYSLIPKNWVDAMIEANDLRLVDWLPGGWDGHQDVFFIARP